MDVKNGLSFAWPFLAGPVAALGPPLTPKAAKCSRQRRGGQHPQIHSQLVGQTIAAQRQHTPSLETPHDPTAATAFAPNKNPASVQAY